MPEVKKERSAQTGIIAWFANNSVAANLLMFGIVIAGLLSAYTIKKNHFFRTLSPTPFRYRFLIPVPVQTILNRVLFSK